MALTSATTAALYAELKKLLNLPDRLFALDLHLGVGEVPTVTCTYHPEIDSDAPTTKRFSIVEIPEPVLKADAEEKLALITRALFGRHIPKE